MLTVRFFALKGSELIFFRVEINDPVALILCVLMITLQCAHAHLWLYAELAVRIHLCFLHARNFAWTIFVCTTGLRACA